MSEKQISRREQLQSDATTLQVHIQVIWEICQNVVNGLFRVRPVDDVGGKLTKWIMQWGIIISRDSTSSRLFTPGFKIILLFVFEIG
jgi:hypothetical protein